jgi:hypothetical protein
MPKYAMSDSRAFTNFLPNCELNNSIQKKYNINNAQEYRIFLQKNATNLMSDMIKCESTEEDCKFCPVCKEKVKKV